MKSFSEHIEYVKGRPYPVRRQIAFTAAGAITALIALVWFTGSLATGAFAISGNSFGEIVSSTTTNTPEMESGLAGAAAALSNVSEESPARIEIVDTTPSTNTGAQVEQTTLAF